MGFLCLSRPLYLPKHNLEEDWPCYQMSAFFQTWGQLVAKRSSAVFIIKQLHPDGTKSTFQTYAFSTKIPYTELAHASRRASKILSHTLAIIASLLLVGT